MSKKNAYPVKDARGAVADFHSLRNTFATLMATHGVMPRVAMELMRHSDSNLTNKTYTDAAALPLSIAVEKLPVIELHHIAHPKGDQTCPKQGKSGQNGKSPGRNRGSVSDSLSVANESSKMAEREGFEPCLIC